jgi:uncharacterized phage protein gp47/JayE
MANLTPKTFDTIVSDQTAAAQDSANVVLDFSVGSVLRAFAEAVAGVALWLYAQIWALLATTRAATSKAGDLDSWMADFGLTRIAGFASTGQLTFTRFAVNSSQPLVPVGSIVQTAQGVQFAVTADPSNANWTGAGYAFVPGVGTLVVPAAALVPAASSNVVAGTVTSLYQSVPGADQVTNAAAFTGGADAESDADFRTRFQQYIIGLSRGDLFGLQYALDSATNLNGLQYFVVENYSVDGVWCPGFFYVVADDATGSPSQSYLDNVMAAVQTVRPLTVRCAVIGPTTRLLNVAMIVTNATGFVHSTVCANVAAAVAKYVNGLGLGAGCAWGDVYTAARAVPGVTGVMDLTVNGVNGEAANVAAVPSQTLKTTTSMVAVS